MPIVWYTFNMKYNGCSAIIVRSEDKKVFIGQRKMTKSFGAGEWETIGGGLELGEDCIVCIKREIKEELNTEIDTVEEFKDYTFSSQEKGKFVIKTFIVSLKGEPQPNKDDFENFGWFSLEEIQKLIFVSNCKERLLDYFEKSKDIL